MALNQLATLIRCGEMIRDMLKPDTDLPEWVQSKITLSTDYIQTAADYLYSEMKESKEVGDDPTGNEAEPNISVKKGKTVITNPVTEATSARARLADAMKKAQEQREREERAGAALLKPKPVKENVEQIDEISKELIHSYLKKRYAQTGATRQDKPKGMSRATHDKQLMGLHRATGRLTTTLQLPKGTDPSQGGKYTADSVEIDGKPIQEGRASQRHPLEGHEYHKKSDEALVHIAKDAHAAAEAMKSHNTTAENKYRDQANDSATVRHYRKTHGMADWYKKKYGHIKEDTNPPFDPPYKKAQGVVTDKSGAKHSPMSRVRDLARNAAKKQSEFVKARNAGSNTKNAKARAAGANNSHMFESRQAEIVREAMKMAKEKKKNNSKDKFIADPELNSKVIKTATQM